MQVNRIALDLAKSVIQVHGVDRSGRVVICKAFKPQVLWMYLQSLPVCDIAMEACSGAHHWGRRLQAIGHRVHLLPAQYVRPFVLGQKNDANDAAAICAAMAQHAIPRVAVKTLQQQDQQAHHRVRGLHIKHRTALINQIRGLLSEYGITAAQSPASLRRALQPLLEPDSTALSFEFRQLLAILYEDWVALDQRIAQLTRRIERQVSSHPDGKRLLQVPGIGPLTASALLASVGDARQFHNGRQMAACLGLVPRQHSSGGKQRLLGIHKRGDSYLRGLLIHGARSVLRTVANKPDARSAWLRSLAARRHRNIAIVAQANKNARIAWSILARQEHYRPLDARPGVC